jgi:alcohol dehydrogenase class IV
MLPYGMEYTYMAVPEKFARIAQAMGEDIEGLSAMEAAERAVSAVRRLCSDIRVPKLRDLDIPEKEYFRLIPQMAKDGMESGTPLVNPRKPTADDVMELFKRAY